MARLLGRTVDQKNLKRKKSDTHIFKVTLKIRDMESNHIWSTYYWDESSKEIEIPDYIGTVAWWSLMAPGKDGLYFVEFKRIADSES